VLALLADTPALPLHEAGRYVAGAYVVFVVLLVVYVAIMASKVARIERELKDVTEFAEQAKASPGIGDDQAAPGREAEDMPADSLTPHGSGGGGV
jgi:hypothetical protein